MGGGVGRVDGHDVVFARTVDVHREIDFAQIDAFTANDRMTRFDQVVLKVGLTQIPSVEWARQMGGIAVPVKQIERRWCFPFEVIAHHIIPDQVIGTQETER